jgi:hypothetical protein
MRIENWRHVSRENRDRRSSGCRSKKQRKHYTQSTACANSNGRISEASQRVFILIDQNRAAPASTRH